MLPGLAPAVIGNGLAELNFIAATTIISSTSTYTFTSQSLGAASPDRRIIVAGTIRFASARTITSITVGGVAATIVAQQTENTNLLRCFVALADVPSGSTGDIVVTMSGSCATARIGVWSALHLNSDTPADTLTANNVADPSGSIDIPANGFVVGVAENTNATSASWTSGLTLRAGENTNNDHYNLHGDASSASPQTITVTADFSSSNTRGILVAASWS